jgi:hypothetical protein
MDAPRRALLLAAALLAAAPPARGAEARPATSERSEAELARQARNPVAGAKANAFLLQDFVNYDFGGGWSVTTSPILTADWTAPADDQWTVPFGAGFGKPQRFGRLPVNLTAAAFWNAVHPRNLPHADWTLRLQVTVLL